MFCLHFSLFLAPNGDWIYNPFALVFSFPSPLSLSTRGCENQCRVNVIIKLTKAIYIRGIVLCFKCPSMPKEKVLGANAKRLSEDWSENGVHLHPKWFLLTPLACVGRFSRSAKLLEAAWRRAWAWHYSRPVSVKICISSNIDNDKNTPKLLFTTCSVTLPLYKSLKNVLSEDFF